MLPSEPSINDGSICAHSRLQAGGKIPMTFTPKIFLVEVEVFGEKVPMSDLIHSAVRR